MDTFLNDILPGLLCLGLLFFCYYRVTSAPNSI
jgi:hypothetical protein